MHAHTATRLRHRESPLEIEAAHPERALPEHRTVTSCPKQPHRELDQTSADPAAAMLRHHRHRIQPRKR